MAFAAGTRLGSYDIVALLGAGGMGEVYRARDARLNRDVAIKVLPEVFTADPERLARFQREAQILAALNHPNIGHIYGLEASGGTHALVLELVEGETLAERIERGPVPLDDALSIARQIADALECAHEQGIIHRDLKPANIKVRDDGTVKVLDFGLAKALEGSRDSGAFAQSAMHSPTLTARGTQLGVIVGTAAYMAPEQARGRAVDRRADIWAFGVILFEMLTGKRAFEGEDVSVTLASVLKDDVKWSDLPADLPPSVRRLLRRCLARDPKRRLSAIGDARLELDEPAEAVVTADRSAAPRAVWRQRMPWAVAAVMAAVAAASVLFWAPWRRSPANTSPLRISADLGLPGPLAVNMGAAAVISPDAKLAVFTVNVGGRSLLYVRRADHLDPVLLNGTDDAHSPFFSPDSQWIGFFTSDKLKKIPVAGGAIVTLCDAPNGRGASWTSEGTIIFQPSNSPQGVLHQVSESGGSSTPLGKAVAGVVTQRWPQVLPGGKAVLYSANSATINWDAGTLMVQPLPAGEPKMLVRGGYYGRYVSSGHLLYIRNGTLFSQPFDPERLEFRGRESPVVDGVLAAPNTGGAQFSVSDSGVLLYVPGKSIDPELPMTWIEKTGQTAVLREEPTSWSQPSFSPDGRQVAMTIGFGISADVWIYEWARDALSQFTFGPGGDSAPAWTPDGRWIAYASAEGTNPVTNIFWKRADGSGDPQRLTRSPHSQAPVSFHRSGKYLAYTEQRPETRTDILILPLEGDDKTGWKAGTPTPFLASAAAESGPAFSPDGHWLAYASSESGRPEVYVRPFGGGEGQRKISVGQGGLNPLWSRARNEIFYLEPISGQMAIMVAEYRTDGQSFQVDRPRRWYPGLITAVRPVRPYDLHPDGNRIVIAKPPDAEPQRKPVFVVNFFDELRSVK